ncbi:hypothetical protein NBRC10512_003893 [Rhodotorula toruloides]|uniref:RHTO0S04e05688g1_1 n=2 Tax=Rhodotorula toruloides TaxID=5286 RepID=A0A061AQT4_RHOTO|nr:uncharacterized protein RHTO_02001 [Rhodotorula toruloides NP11]EMS21130.1 hypothetical protein RHTO_02001 [Rhodotorula toruloides NP11]CDR39489.1 RHTO0S04e05688g1_1 [Rhodotorula toruloides]
MPVDNRNHPYKTTDAKNDEKEHVCKRDFGPDAPNQDASHKSRSDGSFEYSNYDKSKYTNDGKGTETYTPDGKAPFTRTTLPGPDGSPRRTGWTPSI